MTTVDTAARILDTMLGHLGFAVTIETEQTDEGPGLQIHSSESLAIMGKSGERLDDLQYLVNRILRREFPDAERIRVDCGHFRSLQDDKLKQEITAAAERVLATGKPYQLRPLNAYYRRLVHNLLAENPSVVSSSPRGDDRLKQITISAKQAANS